TSSRAKADLQEAQDQLEFRVQERTIELTQALDGLDSERRRFQAILDRLPVSVALLTADRHVLLDNRMFRERFGESHGRHCFETVFGRQEPCEVCESHKVLETMAPHEWQYAGPDGALYHAFDFPFTNTDGASLILKVNVDITQSKQFEAELRERAALLQLAHDAICVKDTRGQIKFWNQGAVETYGWSAEEVIGRNAQDLLQTRYPVPLEEIEAALRERSEWTGELEHLTRDGRSITVASRWSQQRDHEGTPLAVLEINRDISRQKHAEAELLLSQERVSLAQKAGRSGAFEWDIQNNIYSWSTELEEQYGIAPGGFGGTMEVWEALVLPEDLESAKAAIAEALRNGVLTAEWRVRRHTDGQVRWITARGKIFHDEAGRPSRMLGIHWDITELKRAEEGLRESEKVYRAIGESIDYGVWVCGPAGENIYASPSFLKLVGLTQEQCSNLGWKDVLDPDDAERTIAAWKECVRTEGRWDIEHRFRGVDGKWHPILARGVPIRDEAGRIDRWVGINLDISALKQTQDALDESERFNVRILESSQDCIMVLDLAGNLTSISGGARSLFESGETKEPSWIDSWQEADRPRVAEVLAVARAGGVGQFQFLRGAAGMPPLWWDVVVSPICDAADHPQRLLAIARNVTERKRGEEALARKAKELERSNADLQQFAYVASHDLQEPLRMVAQFTQLLSDRYGSSLDQDAREFIAYAVDGATRMQTLILDLLNYSRLGTRGRSFEPVDCNQALRDAIANLGAAIHESHANIAHDELPTVMADASQMVQLFQNLIGNAIKFRGKCSPQVHVSAAREGAEWTFSVRDNGIGFDPQYAERIFVIFQRLHCREEYSGTGIGLALCKKIVERHEGRIWARSELGQGTTFSFSIPGGGLGQDAAETVLQGANDAR
ncbi:MAG: PAS domain S-box protein, partial [Candidatus Solibacter sp.]